MHRGRYQPRLFTMCRLMALVQQRREEQLSALKESVTAPLTGRSAKALLGLTIPHLPASATSL